MLLFFHGTTLTLDCSPLSEGIQPFVYIETPIVIIICRWKFYERG